MYDEPMSLSDLMADEERRRAALAYFGAPAQQAPAASTSAPVQATPTIPPAADFSELAQRFLEAQNADRRDAALSRAGAGLETASRIINAGAGFNQPTMSAGPEVPTRAKGVEEAARIEALGLKNAPKVATAKPGKAPVDPNDPEVKRIQAFARARWPDEPEEVIAAITPATLKEIRTTLDAKYGIKSREGMAADAGERDDKKTKQSDVHFWAKMQQDAEQFGVSDATRRYIAEQALKAAQAARDEAAAAKEKERADAVNVPGFDIAPGATPSPKDAETIKSINGANKELAKSVAALRALHRKYGPSYAGTAGTNIGQITNAIKISAKTIAELGALSGDDNRLMGALAGGDPSTIESVAKSVFGVDNTEAAMNGLLDWAERRISAAAEARGYQPKATKPQRTTPEKVLPKDAAGNYTLDTSSLPPPPSGKVRVRINGKVGLIPKENLEAAKAQGAVEVK